MRQIEQPRRSRPRRDAHQRHAQHREELAEEHRIHRDRGSQHFDDLVALFLDEVGQHHARQHHRQQEQHRLRALRRGQPPPPLAGGAAGRRRFQGDLGISHRLARPRLRRQHRNRAAPVADQALRPGQHRHGKSARKHGGDIALLRRQFPHGIDGFVVGKPSQHHQTGHAIARHRRQPRPRRRQRIDIGAVHDDAKLRPLRARLHPRADAARQPADQHREQRP